MPGGALPTAVPLIPGSGSVSGNPTYQAQLAGARFRRRIVGILGGKMTSSRLLLFFVVALQCNPRGFRARHTACFLRLFTGVQ
jgi:hypothetical protein